MPTYKNRVIEVDRKTNDKGEYLEIKIEGQDGKIYEKKIFGAAVKEITVPGDYETEVEKNSKGFNVITRAKLLLGGSTPVQAIGPKTGFNSPQRDHYTDQAITAQVAMKAAAEVTVAALNKATQPVTSKQATEYITDVMDGLLASAKHFFEKKEEKEEIEDAPF